MIRGHLKVVEVGQQLFGHNKKTAQRYARDQKYPVPAYQIAGEWFISEKELQAHFDSVSKKALEEFKLSR